jgi:syntaxin 7
MELAGAPPSFAEHVRRVSNSLQHAAKVVGALGRYIKRLGSKQDSRELRGAIQTSLGEAQAVMSELQPELAALNEMSQEKGVSKRDRDMRRVQEARLAREFHALRGQLLELANLARAKAGDGAPPSAAVAGGDVEAAATAAENGGARARKPRPLEAPNAEQTRLLDGQDVEEVRLQLTEEELMFNTEVLKEKETEMHAIQRDMAALEDMFRDIATIVVEQGSAVSEIERNTGETAANVRLALSEVQTAASHQRSTRAQICCLLLVLAVAILVGVLLLSRMRLL